MDRDKQIEEMAQVIEQAKHDMWVGKCPTYYEHSKNIAKYLYNAGYRKQNEWISVNERLPDNYQTVLCLMKDGSYRILEWCYPEWAWGDETVWWNERDVAYWMPLDVLARSTEAERR